MRRRCIFEMSSVCNRPRWIVKQFLENCLASKHKNIKISKARMWKVLSSWTGHKGSHYFLTSSPQLPVRDVLDWTSAVMSLCKRICLSFLGNNFQWLWRSMSSVSLLKEYFFKNSPVTHLSLSILFVFLFLFRDAIITDDLFLHISKQAVENKDKNYIRIIHTKKSAVTGFQSQKICW